MALAPGAPGGYRSVMDARVKTDSMMAGAEGRPEFSVVLPVRNEADNVEALVREIVAAVSGRAFEIIFVDDASQDDTRARLFALKTEVPQLRVLVLHGGSRASKLEQVGAADLVVTTYAVLRRDIGRLASMRFRCVVLDEAQNVKSSVTATARAAQRLDSGMRLALSGTPVENRLGELRSIMSFVNPGMLGTSAEFEERFERPIANEPRGAVAEELRALVRPFVLRRTKAEVLKDLPPKTEVVRTCVLGLRQKRLYDALAITLRASVKKAIEKRGEAHARMPVLTAILRLRQMACDPRLVDPGVPASESA